MDKATEFNNEWRGEVVDTKRAAELLGFSAHTLNTLRTRGGGPPFRKVRRKVFYLVDDLRAWIGSRTYTSTSEYEREMNGGRRNGMNQFTDKYRREMEADFDNTREAFKLLDLIDTEFRTDPMSVQCFDLRIVERVKQCVAKRKAFEEKHP